MSKRRAITRIVVALLAIVVGMILGFVSFRIPGTMYQYVPFAQNIKLGIDLKGGVYAVYDIQSEEIGSANLDSRLDGTVSRLQNILIDNGYLESTVVREGSTRIRVEAADVEDSDELFKIMGEPADMVFKLEELNDSTVINEDIGISGSNVEDSFATFIQSEGQYAVQLILDSVGANIFYDVTTKNVGKAINIYINGISVSKAEIKEGIPGGKPVISSKEFDFDKADTLSKQILSGALDVRLQLLNSEVVSASLGEDALRNALIAGVIGIAFILVFLAIVYRGLGLAADIALLLYTVIYIFFLWAFPWVQLSLPGIAGIILSLGMAVDANVVIYERIKEEYKLGKSINASVASGFKKSIWTVMDANITTFIVALVLMVLGQGTIIGFGIMLAIGIVFSLFSSLVISRQIIKAFLALNKHNAKFYGLERGAGYEGLDAESDLTSNIINSDDKGGLANV